MRTLADLARHLNFRGCRQSTGRRTTPIALLTDHRRLADPLPVVARLPAGSLVIFRHYETPARAALARRLAKLCRSRRLHLAIAADFDLAVSLGCGLHLPEGVARQASPRIRLWHRRRGAPLTAAAHGRPGLARAARQGVDALLLSPVFPTLSHPGKPSLGLLAFRRLVRLTPLDVYALGGVSTRTISGLVGSGAAGIAAIGGFDPNSLPKRIDD
jgi:thiamine-phosphate pyrophosphorylase